MNNRIAELEIVREGNQDFVQITATESDEVTIKKIPTYEGIIILYREINVLQRRGFVLCWIERAKQLSSNYKSKLN